MSCDHLEKRVFKNAMEVILKDYYSIYSEFTNGFKDAMNAYYDAWQSEKGFAKTNHLYGMLLGN